MTSFGTVKCLVFVSLVFTSGCLADIRPEEMRSRERTAEEEARGRTLLAESAARYGDWDRFLASGVGRAVFTDSWKSPISRAVAMHWDQNEQNMEIHWGTGSDMARLRVLDGIARGKSFGLVQGVTYEVEEPGAELQIVDDADYRFALPTVIYFLEFPYRIQSAEIVRYIGDETIDGVAYDLVFASWGSEAPTTDYDQYIVYINKSTGLMDRLYYTIREKFRFTSASCLYSDFQLEDDLLIPRVMTLVTAPDARDDVFHEMIFSDIELGADVPEGYLTPPTVMASLNQRE